MEKIKLEDGWYPLERIDKNCFGCGSSNANGLQMAFESDGAVVRSGLVMESRFCGWGNLIHGGVLSTILDETMGWTVIHLAKSLMLTRQMSVTFNKPVRVGMRVEAEGRIKDYVGRKRVLVEALIKDEHGEVLASSEGEFALCTRKQFLRLGVVEEEELAVMTAAIPQ